MAARAEAVFRADEAASGSLENAALVHAASLAPSGHNAQPWRFRTGPVTVDVFADFRRRLRVVDPDDHELYIGLGCAIENMAVAAAGAGLCASVEYRAGGGVSRQLLQHAARVHLARAPHVPTFEDRSLAAAIPRRQVTRRRYADTAIPRPHLARLMEAAGADGDSVRAQFFTDAPHRAPLEEFVLEGSRQQFREHAFRRELADWIRFDRMAAASSTDGLPAAVLGMPWSPQPIGRFFFEHLLASDAPGRTAVQALRSSPVVVLFIAARHDPRAWMSVGRAFQRMALVATTLGISHAHVNMPCEVPAVRAQLKAALRLDPDEEPLLLIRLGYSEQGPRSPRRPVPELLLNDAH